jgi:hypothetical protein
MRWRRFDQERVSCLLRIVDTAYVIMYYFTTEELQRAALLSILASALVSTHLE